jgi:acyl-CoA synthetase (AMP-forming)/AMP-acid ligase II
MRSHQRGDGVIDRAWVDGRSLWELIERRADATPEGLLAIDPTGRQMTFAEYRAAALRAAAGFAAMGVKKGVTVSWVQPTCIDAVVLTAALCRLDANQNPIIPIYRQREVGFVVRQVGAKFLIVPGVFRKFDYAEMAREIAAEAPGLEVCVVDGTLPDGDPASLPPAPEAPATPDDSPVRWFFYTSGTTSDAKGARHTDETLMSTIRGLADVLDLRADDRHAFAFPFTHVGGIGWLMAGLISGMTQLLADVWDPDTTIPFFAKHGVTQAGAGTAFHQAYLAAQREQPSKPLFPSIRTFPGGAAPKPPQLHYDLKNEMGGVGIISGYGLTECPIIAMNSTRDPDEKLANTEGSVNPRNAEIRVVTLEGKLAGPGEEGEFRIKGPQLCKGYVDESLNEAGFDEEGYFRTGDLGYLDAEGFVVITGRLKDVIIRKGENISAKEVEDLLYEHPKVGDVAVIGLPDPALGERCCAVVSSEEGSEALAFDEMVAFLKGRGLMLQKIPEQLEIVAEVPRNPTGKILKNKLREQFG